MEMQMFLKRQNQSRKRFLELGLCVLAKKRERNNLVPRVLSLPPWRKYPGFGWSRGTENLGANKNVLQGRGSKV